jgi:hypothetical protein
VALRELVFVLQETLQLTIGHHRVDGKLVQLKKPLAILHKAPATGADGVAYEVVGVVRSKYHFKNRPLALISAPVAGKKPKHAGASAASNFFRRKETS